MATCLYTIVKPKLHVYHYPVYLCIMSRYYMCIHVHVRVHVGFESHLRQMGEYEVLKRLLFINGRGPQFSSSFLVGTSFKSHEICRIFPLEK